MSSFDIFYSDDELRKAEEIRRSFAKKCWLPRLKKEQEKMNKYEINLQEVAEDLREYLNDYNIYTEVNKENSYVCVRLRNYNAPCVVILNWNDGADIEWTDRWEVQPVSAKYYIKRGPMPAYELACLIQDIDNFLSDWYCDNEEPEPDIKTDLPQAIINKLKIAFNDNRNEIDAHYYDNSLFVSIINPNNLATIEAGYVIKNRSAFLTSCHTGGAFLTKEADVSTIVRKCVMEWDK